MEYAGLSSIKQGLEQAYLWQFAMEVRHGDTQSLVRCDLQEVCTLLEPHSAIPVPHTGVLNIAPGKMGARG